MDEKTKATRRGSPKVGVWKKRILLSLAITLSLVAIAYLARRPLFESTVIAEIESQLEPLLGVDVEVGAVRGNWLTEVSVEGVNIRGRDNSAYREISDLSLELRFSPFALMAGDLSGLSYVRARSKRVVLDLEKEWTALSFDDDSPASSTGSDSGSMSLADLLAMLQAGGSVTVDELVLLPDYVRTASAEVTLDPGTTSRSATVVSGGSRVTGKMDTSGAYDVTVRGDEGGRLLRALGVTSRTTDAGEIEGTLRGNSESGELETGLRLSGTLRDGQAIGIDYLLTWKGDRLRAPRLEVNLPGFSVSGDDLAVPVEELVAQAYHTVLKRQSDGSIAVRITSLAPYDAWIDALFDNPTGWQIRSLYPITGDLRFVVDEGVVRLRASRLRGTGLELRIEEGTLALAEGAGELEATDFRNLAATDINFSVDIPEELAIAIEAADQPKADQPKADQPKIAGRIEGTISGSVERLVIDVDLALRDLGYRELRIGRFTGHVKYDGESLELTAARIEAAGRAGQDYSVSAACTATWRIRDRRIVAELRGEVPTGALADVGIPDDVLADITLAPLTVRAEIRTSPDPRKPTLGNIQMEIPSVAYRGLPEFRFHSHTTTSLLDGKISDRLLVENLVLRGMLGEISLGGSISLSTGDYDVVGSGRIADLLPICDLLKQHRVAGSVHIEEFSAKGSPSTPLPESRVKARAEVTSMAPELIPLQLRGAEPKGPLRIDLNAVGSTSGVHVNALQATWGSADRRLEIRGSGPVPIEWSTELRVVERDSPLRLTVAAHVSEPGLAIELPGVTVNGEILLGARSVRIPSLTARSEEGSIQIESLTLELDVARAFANTLEWSTIPLNGRVAVREYRFGKIASQWMGPASTRGRIGGELTLAGPVGAPTVTGSLTLEQGRVEYPGAPTVEALRGKVEFSPRRVELKFADARSGGATHHIAATLRVVEAAAQQTLSTALLNGGIPLDGTFQITGIDLAGIGRSVDTLSGLRGHVACSGTLKGPVESWEPALSVDVTDASWPIPDSETKIENLSLSAVLVRDRIEITKFTGSVPELGLDLDIDGELSVTDAALWEIPTAKDPEIKGSVRFAQIPLELLARKLKLEVAEGVFDCELELGGTFSNPAPKLKASVRGRPASVVDGGAAIKFKSLPRVQDLSATLTANETICTLTANAAIGAGPVSLRVQVLPGEGELLDAYLGSAIHATLNGTDVLLVRHSGLKVRGGLNLQANGPLDKVTVTGDVELRKSRYVRRLSLVPDLKVSAGEGSGGTFGPWTIPGGDALVFDVNVKTIDSIEVRTNVIDTDLDVACNLKGQANNLYLTGTCASSKGTIRFPGMGMRITSLRLLFSEAAPTRPNVLASASGKRHGIHINLRLHGPWDGPPTIALSSTPALQPRDLWSLVTTGVRPEALAANSTASNTAILATYVIQELVLSYLASDSTEAAEGFVSRFTFEFGEDVSRDGAETWEVNFDLGGLWIVPPSYGARFERDVYEDFNLGLVYRWRF